ncbi:hypothetical protein BX266_6695 [Streptomyces sp. TLI_171]|nr:hypothetical protein BX266_6695 [Streptomyces sp. TLI_171]
MADRRPIRASPPSAQLRTDTGRTVPTPPPRQESAAPRWEPRSSAPRPDVYDNRTEHRHRQPHRSPTHQAGRGVHSDPQHQPERAERLQRLRGHLCRPPRAGCNQPLARLDAVRQARGEEGDTEQDQGGFPERRRAPLAVRTRNSRPACPWASMPVRLPAALDAQLQPAAGMSHFGYQVLAGLSMTPGRTLRISDLAEFAACSLSRLSHTAKRLEAGRKWWPRHRGTSPRCGGCWWTSSPRSSTSSSARSASE